MICRRPRQTCPACGGVFQNLKQHTDSMACAATCKAIEMRKAGFARMKELPERFANYMAPRCLEHLVRSVKTRAGNPERWLPKWACAMLLDGNWGEVAVQRVEGDLDLQVALALEYDLRAK